MSKEVVDAGIQTVSGKWQAKAGIAKARTLARATLKTVKHRAMPVRAAILMATADWCHPSNSISKVIREELYRLLKYKVPLLGGSMAGIYCFTGEVKYIKHGLALLLVCSNDLWMTVGSLPNPHAMNGEDREHSLKEMAHKLEERAGTRIGTSANRHLMGILPGFVPTKHSGPSYADCELHDEIIGAFDGKYRLFGGSAADALEPTIGYQFADNECLPSGLALAIVETDLRVGAVMNHSCRPRRDLPQVCVNQIAGGADAGYEVSVLDGKPAAERIKDLKRQIGVTGKATLLLGVPFAPDHQIAVPLTDAIDRKGAVRFNRTLAKGDYLQILDMDVKNAFSDVQHAIRCMYERSGSASRSGLELILAFSCTGRMLQYEAAGVDVSEAAQVFHKEFPGALIMVGLCAGEYGIGINRQPRANNMSLTMAGVVDATDWRAHTRKLQTILLDYSGRLTTCRTPHDVMKCALEGAVAAGALGGQICIADTKIGRIINQGYGFSLRVPDSPQDWKMADEGTNREMPKEIVELPPDLAEYAMPAIREDSRLPGSLRIGKRGPKQPDEDLLTLVIQTRHAILAYDYRESHFHCDQVLSKRAGIVTHLAIPLIGPDDTPIATIQIGLKDHQRLDREQFSLWIAYAHKVAAELERAQEAEERQVTAEFQKLAADVIHQHLTPGMDPYYWCDRHLQKVVELLGANGAHMRVFHKTVNGAVYRLIGAMGHMADLIRDTRPETRATDGGVNPAVLKAGGIFANTPEEAGAVGKRAYAVKHPERNAEYQREHNKIAATALLPLSDTQLLGSFIIDSLRPHFFTTRRQRLALAAASAAAGVIRVLTEEERRLKQEVVVKTLLDALASPDNRDPDARLRLVVDRIRNLIGADVGSLFVWHPEVKRLILLIQSHWHDPSQEGVASYAGGEGWTGSLPWRPEEQTVFTVGPHLRNRESCSMKYYDYMVPPEWRVGQGEVNARVGIRFEGQEGRVGVATFTYYKGSEDKLIRDEEYLTILLQRIGPVLGLYVHAAIQHIQIHRRNRLRDTLTEVADGLVQATGTSRWANVLEKAQAGMEVERAWLFLRDDAAGNPRMLLECAVPPYSGRNSLAPVPPRGFLVAAALKGRTVQIKEADKDEIQGARTLLRCSDIRALLAEPVLTAEGQELGVIILANHRRCREHPWESFDLVEQLTVSTIARLLGSAIDISRRRADQQRLNSQIATAVRVGAASVAAGLMMHTFKTPLAIIRRTVEWLEARPNCSKAVHAEQLRQIKGLVDRAFAVLAEARDAGVLAVKTVRLQRIIAQALRTIQPIPNGIHCEIDNDLDVMVRVNAFSVIGALVNLFQNAVEAMGRKGVLTVRVNQSANKRTAIVSIHNTGPRFSAGDLDRFITPRFSTKSSDEHFGLGLPLAIQAIKAIKGGEMFLRSPAGGGMEIQIHIPVTSDDNGRGDG